MTRGWSRWRQLPPSSVEVGAEVDRYLDMQLEGLTGAPSAARPAPAPEPDVGIGGGLLGRPETPWDEPEMVPMTEEEFGELVGTAVAHVAVQRRSRELWDEARRHWPFLPERMPNGLDGAAPEIDVDDLLADFGG